MERIALRIGEVAARAGVHRETLRYYERRGLIPPPPRRISGYRAYPAETVERVRLIKWAQGLGFALRELVELSRIPRDHVRGRTQQVRSRAVAKISTPSAAVRSMAGQRIHRNPDAADNVLAHPTL